MGGEELRPVPLDLDLIASRLRRVEARTAALEDSVGVYGPPDGRPLFSVRLPRAATLTPSQTKLMVYACFLGGLGLYTFAKYKAKEDL